MSGIENTELGWEGGCSSCRSLNDSISGLHTDSVELTKRIASGSLHPLT